MANKTILWVGDDKEVLSAFESRFRSQGWQVVWAPAAHEGKALAREFKPDVIIMDIVMTGERGYAAIKEFKSTPGLEDVFIIVFSGISHRQGETKPPRLDGLLSEADELVDRSENPDVLLSAVRRCLQTQAV